nr:hypothetical protein [Shewanella algae]
MTLRASVSVQGRSVTLYERTFKFADYNAPRSHNAFLAESEEALSPADYVAKLDNQWVIVQTVFLVDTVNKVFKEGRTRGQFLSSSYQDAISSELQAFYTKSDR